MTYNVFGGTLSLTQSINQSVTRGNRKIVEICLHRFLPFWPPRIWLI